MRRRPVLRRGLLAAVALVVAGPSLLGQLPAAITDRYAITRSFAPGSPEVGSTHTAGDVDVTNSTMAGGGGIQWPYQELGIPSFVNIDAFTDATDIFPPAGPAVVQPPVLCGYLFVEYTVDKQAQGVAGGIVHQQVVDDGAASDTFGVHYRASGARRFHMSDHFEVSPLPTETDLDSLSWRERRRYPVYFSVDVAGAGHLGVDPGDILVSDGSGSWAIHLEAKDLGLLDGDDIDALSIHGVFAPGGPPERYVFSLTKDSPTVAPGGVHAGVAGAGLLVFTGAGALEAWAEPHEFQLQSTDELNGVRITDPAEFEVLDCSQVDGDGVPLDVVQADGTAGNADHIVELTVGVPFTLSIVPRAPENPAALYLLPKRPCFGEGFLIQDVGWMSFVPITKAIIFPGETHLPFTLNGMFDVTFQGVMLDVASGDLYTTNALTISLR